MASEAAPAPATSGNPWAHPAALRAIEALDQVLAKRPHKDDHLLARIEEDLCTCREAVLGRRRQGMWRDEDERRLGRLNGVLSVTLAIHFPLGDVRWDELAGARAALAELAGVG